MSGPGRTCPLAYRYAPEVLHKPAAIRTNTLYVVGGLYGNPYALETVLALAAAEREPAKIVFNGDFNWFDIDPADFAAINRQVLLHTALRGNVETELGASDDAAGCGCGYPDWVGDAEVSRSNLIMSRLKETAARLPGIASRLAALPATLVAEIGGLRVGVVHGDCESLAGWSFSQESLRDNPNRAREQLARSGVRVLASSHTCLPVAVDFDLPQGRTVLINNGAAGMPNFRDSTHGVVTRISLLPSTGCLYATAIGAVHIEALAVAYNHSNWRMDFDRVWPPDSAAALSYRDRILHGPRYGVESATRWRHPGTAAPDRKTPEAA